VVEHAPYFNAFLDETFCHADGEYWPCLATRQAAECLCSHTQATHDRGAGECWSLACGCRTFRLRVTA
jgi:hypothetical protein